MKNPLYGTWKAMKSRCYRKTDIGYRHYGGKGVTVCDRWLNSFDAFVEDMGPRPDGAQLDRIDSSGNYEPSNCRWATTKQQSRNRRTNHFIEHGGERLTLSEWAERFGLNRRTLSSRLFDGWSLERALNSPPDQLARQPRKTAPYERRKEKRRALKLQAIANATR